MLNQFRASYPQGSLISELVIIDRGKYLVRTLVQVEGITLATGLAAADTVEQAEDRARERALAALNLSALPTRSETDQQEIPSHADASQAALSLNSESANGESKGNPQLTQELQNRGASHEEVAMPVDANAASQGVERDRHADEVGAGVSSFNTDVPELDSGTRTDSVQASAHQEPLLFSSPDSSPHQTSVGNSSQPLPSSFEEERSEPVHGTQSSEFAWASSDQGADIGSTEEAAPLLGSSSITPEDHPPATASSYSFGLSQRSSEPLESAWASSAEPPADNSPEATASVQSSLSDPIDFSDIIAKTNVEMKRLGWTSEQGRKYLLETYGKRSRQLLSDEELLDFLHHLESLSAS